MSNKSNEENIRLNFCPRCGKKIGERSGASSECPYCGFNLGLLQPNISQGKGGVPTPTLKKKEKIKIKDEEIINNQKAFWRPKASIFWPLISLMIIQR